MVLLHATLKWILRRSGLGLELMSIFPFPEGLESAQGSNFFFKDTQYFLSRALSADYLGSYPGFSNQAGK